MLPTRISRTRRGIGPVVALTLLLAGCATGEGPEGSDVEVPDRGRRDVPSGDPDVPDDAPDAAPDVGDTDQDAPLGDTDLGEADADATFDADAPEDDGGGGPEGETCANAPLLTPGTHDHDTAGFGDDYALYNGNCGGLMTPGPDAVFRVEVPPSSTLQASLTPGPGYDAALLITSSCENVGGLCLEASDDAGAAGAESVTVYNTTGSTLTWFLIVDSTGAGATGTYTVTLAYEQ